MSEHLTAGPAARDHQDNPYLSLAEVGDDTRWAFGGGFDDPLEGVDTSVPSDLDAAALAAVCLALGDGSLLTAQTLQRWCTRAPELEEEVALANIALDLIGQTRLLYARAAAARPELVPQLPPGSPLPAEDRLAFFRDPADFHAGALTVMPDADFAALMLRLAAVATWRDVLWRELRSAPDPVLAAVADRAVGEVAYHRDLSTRWVRVLAGGTEESARRLAAARQEVEPHVDGLTELPPAAAADPVWVEAWTCAGTSFATAWAEVSMGSTGGQGSVVEQRCEASARRDHSAAGHSVSTSSTELVGWRDELVTELQSVARQHPEGRW